MSSSNSTPTSLRAPANDPATATPASAAPPPNTAPAPPSPSSSASQFAHVNSSVSYPHHLIHRRPSPSHDSPHIPKRARRHSSHSLSSGGDSEDRLPRSSSDLSSHSGSPPAGPAPLPFLKMRRSLTTPHQTAVLHALLAQTRFPTTAQREEVGRAIGLSARKVQIWFQNQRQKDRRPWIQSQSDVAQTQTQYSLYTPLPYPSAPTDLPHDFGQFLGPLYGHDYGEPPAPVPAVRALEETVQRLEARLHGLEHPEEATPSTMFQGPSPVHTHSPVFLPAFSTIGGGGTPPYGMHGSTPPYSSYGSTSPYGSYGSTPPYGSYRSTGTPPYSSYVGTPPLAYGSQRDSPSGEPNGGSPVSLPSFSLEFDRQLCDSLIKKFLPHASQFGLFLDTGSNYGLLPTSFYAAPALLNAMCIWGAHLSADRSREEQFRSKALQYAVTDLSVHTYLHTLQAEVLLAYFFWRTGGLLKARTHAATAPAEAPLLELTEPQYPDHSHYYSVRLPPPGTALEEGERINGFWAVLTLQKGLAVALEPAAQVCGVLEASGMQIDTPWPLELEEYKRGLLGANVRGELTVHRFLSMPAPSSGSNLSDHHDSGDSLTAVHVKANVLLHRAVYLHGQWRPALFLVLHANLKVAIALYPGVSERADLLSAIRTTDVVTSSLREQLLLLEPSCGDRMSTIVLTHALLNSAAIRLHGISMDRDPLSQQRCVAAAMDMLRLGVGDTDSEVNPIMGTLWAAACGVLVDELKRLRAVRDSDAWPQAVDGEKTRYEKDVSASLQEGLGTLRGCARESVWMGEFLLFATSVAEAYFFFFGYGEHHLATVKEAMADL
ncbi:hypothetical protein GGX14DRAFT_610793 [Mycena pura]|uniref:Homeobox domain-containing protein n=1 Tax=Mycena pura TaxID=153505 RepID=A0AAD6VRI3_9AGAR|nr:hypothetical protein GGX14DRAFT_610793 [Mycena pura]